MFGVVWWDGRGKMAKEDGRPRKGGNHGSAVSFLDAAGNREELRGCSRLSMTHAFPF